MLVSIFNDVIGPVMRGPSSSHCAAALRIGRLARDLMGGPIDEVLVEFDRQGSLPTTHESQGSDMGLFGGLLGWEAADERLPHAFQTFLVGGGRARFETVDAQDPHPNTYRLTLRRGQDQHFLRAISTGGGMIEVLNIDGFPVSLFGDAFTTLLWSSRDAATLANDLRTRMVIDAIDVLETEGQQLVVVQADQFVPDFLLPSQPEPSPIVAVRKLAPVLPVLSRLTTRVPFTTAFELLRFDAGQETPLWKHAVAYEMARGSLTEEAVMDRMLDIVRILRRSIAQGIAGTHYDDRVLGHQSGRFQSLMDAGRLLPGGALNRVVLYVTALMEVKSSMGVIVAAPTAGACAALPGAVIALAEEQGLGEIEMARAMLAAGLIGVFIATRWTFAAEVGGCQAEGGSAASMAAAALVDMAGGTLTQSLAAGSLAFQSMLGLICDPIANRVEAPCLGKNVMAASNALCCANMALAHFDPLIPLDEVILAAMKVSESMPREHRCTALGGLSITPASQAIEQQLRTRKSPAPAPACGTCGCH
jgi:L-serine dehydratase